MTEHTGEIPAAVTIPHREAYRLLVQLLKAEIEVEAALDECDFALGEDHLNIAIGDFYRLAFGRMFIDDDGPELPEPICFAPTYLRALYQAEAEIGAEVGAVASLEAER